ncbi:MAG: hypothetical protein RLZ51_1850 [Pseudomonadota bacterium]
MAQLKPKTRDELEALVAGAVQDAVDFIESEIAPERVKAQQYFDGEVDIGVEEGRSKVVATKVRDTIRQVKPSLMRIFLSHEKPAEFVPVGPEDVASAEQATIGIQKKLEQSNGFRLLNDAFDDALRKKTGILKVWWEDQSKAEVFTFTDLSDDELMLVLNEPGVEVLEHTANVVEQMDPMGMAMSMSTHDLKISRTETRGKMCVASVPPEEFFVDSRARDAETAYIHGQRTEMRVGDLVEMGFAFDDVVDLGSFDDGGDDLSDEERDARRKYTADYMDDESASDPAMRKVTLTEAYMRVDVDGTGVPVLHRFLLGGTGYKLLDFEPADESPFAVFEIDPEPHAFFGRSIYDLIKNEQDAGTAVLRGILDNVAMTNSPRTGAVEGMVNMSDLLNNEIGGVVRMRQIDAVRELSVPFVAGQTLPALQYIDDLVEQKTGVTRASQGLDPDALQSTTKAAVTATISAAAAQVETMARNLAEGGLRRLYKIMLHLWIKHARGPEMMRLNTSFVPMDPRVWNADMDVTINVGLGTGREEEKQMALAATLQTQMGIMQAYGPQNPLVGLTEIRNTLADILFAAGVRNADRYYRPMSMQIEQQLMGQAAQAAAQQQPQQDPQSAAFLQAEQMKVSARVQADMQKNQIEAMKAQMADDRERDRMAQDLYLRAAEIEARSGVAVQTAQIKAEQAAMRGPGGAPAGNGGVI